MDFIVMYKDGDGEKGLENVVQKSVSTKPVCQVNSYNEWDLDVRSNVLSIYQSNELPRSKLRGI
jgi:hypothetical protein